MRFPAAAMALGMLAALAFGVWATGCTGLSNDCELNLNCHPTQEQNAPKCDGKFFSPQCDPCLAESCCQELSECDADGTCLFSCAFTVLPSPIECGKPPTFTPFDNLKTCMKTSCADACAPIDQCNAVTNNGCMPNWQCDVVFPGLFVCFEPFGTPAPICAPCDNLKGPYCGPGLRCHAGSNMCGKYCCTDADCGTGRCELDPMKAIGSSLELSKNVIGVCVTMDGATPACDAPATPPSNGACFTSYPP